VAAVEEQNSEICIEAVGEGLRSASHHIERHRGQTITRSEFVSHQNLPVAPSLPHG
jgi:hypothetical protein